MRSIAPIAISSILLLGACSGNPPSAHQRAAARNDLNPSGRPYDGPPGVPVSNPPGDNNFDRLTCHPEGPGMVCGRGHQPGSLPGGEN
jgi:hypothetical protein